MFAHQFPFRAIRSDTGCRVAGWHSDTTSIKGVSLIRITCWWYMLLANQETVSHCAIVRYTSCNRHLSTTNFLLLGITYVPQNLPLLSQTTRSCSALRLAPPFGSITNSDSPPALHEFGNVKPFVANFQHRACRTRDEHLLRRFRRGEEICPPYISAIFHNISGLAEEITITQLSGPSFPSLARAPLLLPPRRRYRCFRVSYFLLSSIRTFISV